MTATTLDTSELPGISAPPGATARRHDLVAIGTLAALLLGTAALYLWGLDRSGWANSFYSAAAQAGSQNWTAWFFGSSDAGNSITVDKPPASLWLMGLSVRLFGLNSWSILVPQALLGVAGVGVLYASLRRTVLHGVPALPTVANPARFAHWTALAGAAILALTPVATLMFRFNNPDALLVFCLVVAAAATLRASENASRRWLLLAGAAIGIGFLTKMLQAFVVLPVLALAYLVAVAAPRRKALVDLLAAFAAVLVSAGWYVAIVELLPADRRPFIGGSQTNSILELAFGYNGLGRLTGTEVGSVGAQGGPGVGQESLWRMFAGVSGGMVSWLLPAALVLGTVALVLLGRRPATPDGTPEDAARHLRGGLVLWLGWLLLTAGVFSAMSGIYHDYYTVALAPAIGASVALGGAVSWAHRQSWLGRGALAGSALGSSVWALFLLRQAGGTYLLLGYGVATVGFLAAVGLLAGPRLPRRVTAAALVAALAAGLAGPAAYSLNTAATPHTGSIVTAGPVQSFGSRGTGVGSPGGPDGRNGRSAQPGGRGQPPAPGGQPGQAPQGARGGGFASRGQGGPGDGMGGLLNGQSVSAEIAEMLSADAERFTWVAATVGSQNAASYQLATGHPVMPLGGFNGSDPSPTLAQFQELVAQQRIHYFLGGGGFGQQNGGARSASEIAAWVQQNFPATTVGDATVYDLTQAK